MSYRLFSTGAASALFGSSPVIPAAEARDLRGAAKLLEAAAAIHAETEAARDAAIAQGQREGRAQAQAERDAFAAERLASTITQVAQAHQRLQDDIASLALAALRHILGELPDEIVVTSLVRKASERLPAGSIAHIRVAPALKDRVAARLGEPMAALVEADASLPPTGCVLSASAGQVIASLDLQLERLAERWQVGETA